MAYVRPYRKWLIVSIIALLFSTLLSLVLPLVIQNLVDDVLIEQNLGRLEPIGRRLAGCVYCASHLQLCASTKPRLSWGNAPSQIYASKVYSHLQSLSLQFFADYRTGEVVSRLTNDVSLLQNAVTTNLVSLLRQAVLLIGASIFLFILDWRLTLIILTGIPIMSLTMVWLGRKIRKAAKASPRCACRVC